MVHLTQREEQILLAVWKLKEDAYLVAIKKHLAGILKQDWTVGAIHRPLRHLEKLGLIEPHLGEATAKRGGRAKKIYSVTGSGLVLLNEYKRINESLWGRFPGLESAE
jgi:DNA-binding PadR family transcriptional regulator